MAQAIQEPPLPVQKAQVLIHYLDSAKNKFRNLAVRMLNGLRAFFKRNPPWLWMVIYVFCMGVALMMWIVMGFLDLAAGTNILETVIRVVEGLNEAVLPILQLLNGLLALLLGFYTLSSMLNIDIDINDHSIDPNNNISFCRSKIIIALPEAKYGCLRISDDVIGVIHLQLFVQSVWGVLGRRMKSAFFPTADTIFTFLALIGGFFHVLSITLHALCAEPL